MCLESVAHVGRGWSAHYAVQCGAVCYGVLQRVAGWCRVVQSGAAHVGLRCDAVWCSVVQCGAVSCSMLQYAAVCCSVLQCSEVCFQRDVARDVERRAVVAVVAKNAAVVTAAAAAAARADVE